MVVIGDALLDRDVVGRVSRICPDAPVPVVDEQEVVDRAGGAGLAAVLAARRCAHVVLVCALAPDGAGVTLRLLLEARGIEVIDIGDRHHGRTVEKVRIRAGGQSLLRLDRGDGATVGDVPALAGEASAASDALLVADYGRGVTAHPEVRAIVARARRSGTPVVWDPHPRGSVPVRGVTLVVPNQEEAAGFDPSAGLGSANLGLQVQRARRLRRHWGVGGVAITMGERGAVLASGDGAPLVVPVDDAVLGADPCGAGDAFACGAAVAAAQGAVLSEAVQEGVRAASTFVAAGGAAGMSAGAAVSTRSPSMTATDVGPAHAAAAMADVTVATGGCFDLVHAGHVATLERARSLGDRLVVLLNSDESVRRLKGEGRPVQTAADRASVLRSLGCVDEVVVFDEDTPVEALRRIRPEVFVKGGDYSAAQLPETEVLSEWGGTVVTVPFLEGRSTSAILERRWSTSDVG